MLINDNIMYFTEYITVTWNPMIHRLIYPEYTVMARTTSQIVFTRLIL